MMHKIDVDEDVWNFLKKHAEPFEDTPNSVLRRFLLANDVLQKGDTYGTSFIKPEFPTFSRSLSAALQQILEMIFLVKRLGYTRTEATNLIAERRKIAPQTVIDKYCRQLNKQAYEIDRMLEGDLNLFKILLEKQFSNHREDIQDFFNSLI